LPQRPGARDRPILRRINRRHCFWLPKDEPSYPWKKGVPTIIRSSITAVVQYPGDLYDNLQCEGVADRVSIIAGQSRSGEVRQQIVSRLQGPKVELLVIDSDENIGLDVSRYLPFSARIASFSLKTMRCSKKAIQKRRSSGLGSWRLKAAGLWRLLGLLIGLPGSAHSSPAGPSGFWISVTRQL
jgi:hypothetical protein